MAHQEKPLLWLGSSKKEKSKSGIATPKADIEIIRARLKVAETIAKEMRDEKTHP
jgi:hypothetical protein